MGLGFQKSVIVRWQAASRVPLKQFFRLDAYKVFSPAHFVSLSPCFCISSQVDGK